MQKSGAATGNTGWLIVTHTHTAQTPPQSNQGWCHHRSVSGPNFGSYKPKFCLKRNVQNSDKQTKPGMKVLGCRWDPPHGVFRHRAYRSACILGHVMAIRVAYCMPHAPPGPAQHMLATSTHVPYAPLLVIGPRYASCVSSFVSYNTQSAYLKVSSWAHLAPVSIFSVPRRARYQKRADHGCRRPCTHTLPMKPGMHIHNAWCYLSSISYTYARD